MGHKIGSHEMIRILGENGRKVTRKTVWYSLKQLCKRNNIKVNLEEGKENRLFLHPKNLDSALQLFLNSDVGLPDSKKRKRVSKEKVAKKPVKNRVQIKVNTKKTVSQKRYEENRQRLTDGLYAAKTALYMPHGRKPFFVTRFSTENNMVSSE